MKVQSPSLRNDSRKLYRAQLTSEMPTQEQQKMFVRFQFLTNRQIRNSAMKNIRRQNNANRHNRYTDHMGNSCGGCEWCDCRDISFLFEFRDGGYELHHEKAQGIHEQSLESWKKVFAGVKTFVKKIQKGVNTKGVNTVVQEIVKEYTYQRDKQRWIVTETTREVPPDKVKEEIPADILKKVGIMTEYDVTDRVKMKLEKCA